MVQLSHSYMTTGKTIALTRQNFVAKVMSLLFNMLSRLVKGNAKECSKYHTIALISHASKVMLKILQARLQQYKTMNFHMFNLALEKAEEPEIKLPTFTGSWKKEESSRKTSISALLTMPKPLTVWITINCGKF